MVRTLPTVVKLRAVDEDFVVRRGAAVPCRLKLDRTPNFNGAMQVELMEPANSGFSCRPMQIAAGESAVTVMLDVSSEADAPLNRSLKFRAVGMMDDVRVISEVTLPVKVVD